MGDSGNHRLICAHTPFMLKAIEYSLKLKLLYVGQLDLTDNYSDKMLYWVVCIGMRKLCRVVARAK